MALIDDVRRACRITTTSYDPELTDLINAAKLDLEIAGVDVPYDDYDELTKTAIITFCKMRFGIPEDYERLKASYDEQKAQLGMNSVYTTWT